ncbi:CHAT domain-containing tetratricopeptide repeat protein [Aquimarina sp. AU474]|uniref:CHAT domain-containing protein n=1 Tax=Aquimarina sp. AU474 TaxID=2108529 RepID=UPI001F1C51C1|nr:CHAT domain-containing tetratricopeptide repeat protein [Aquimarina sp. AU474]
MGQEISFALDSIHQLEGSDYEKLVLYQDLLDTYEQNKDYTQLGHDAHQLAKWIHSEKKWTPAIDIAQTAYKAREKAIPFHPENLKRSYYNYANFHRRIGKYTIAIRYFRKMLEVKESDFFHARAYGLIGKSYTAIGDPYQALENQLQAFKYFDPVKDKVLIISNHINTSITYSNKRTQKNFDKAISHLLTADSLISTIKNPSKHELYAINNNLGGMYYQKIGKENDIKAIAYFEKALELAKEMKINKNLAQINLNLGTVYSASDMSVANTYLKKALTYTTNKKANYLIPEIYTEFGAIACAKKEYQKALEYYTKSFLHYFNIETDDIHWLPSKKELANINDKTLVFELLKRKLEAYLAQGKKGNNNTAYTNAIRTVKTSSDLVDLIMRENLSNRSKLYWKTIASQIYISGIEACYQVQNLEDAFYFMEKNKALLLTQEISKKKTNTPEEILEHEKKIEKEIIHLQKIFRNISDIKKDSISDLILTQKNELQQFKDSLSKQYPVYFSSVLNPKTISYSQLEVKNNEVIIEYTMTETVARVVPNAYGMVISKDHQILFKLTDNQKLLDNIYSLRTLLNTPFKSIEDITTYKNTAHELFTTLFPEQIRDYLTNKKVTIIADHMLSFIPFEALVTNIDMGTYLIEDCEINYTYSLSFQKENANITRQTDYDFLGIAPVQFKNGLVQLSKSEKEINTAKTYYTGSILVGETATKENFIKQASNYKILHLATHANASDTITPWIAFHDSKLIPEEFNTFENNAELVILSACNTSLGELQKGEGVLSLARGFFKSGANTVIPSLWSTNDKTTASITSDFYNNLSKGKTKSKALRMAKLNYLNNNTDAEASPHYWAPLILIGDSTTLLPIKEYNVIQIVFMVIIGIIICMVFFYFFRKIKKTSI